MLHNDTEWRLVMLTWFGLRRDAQVDMSLKNKEHSFYLLVANLKRAQEPGTFLKMYFASSEPTPRR